MEKLILGIVVLLLFIIICVLGIRAIRHGHEQRVKQIQLLIAVLAIVVDLFGLIIPGAGEVRTVSDHSVFIKGDGNIINIGNGPNVFLENQGTYDNSTLAVSDVETNVIRVYDRYTVGWSDNLGGRESYTSKEYVDGAIDGKIVFNSISDGVIGHEFNFVGAREYTLENSSGENRWSGDVIEAEEGKIYLVRLYAHNNGDSTAEDVSIRFLIDGMVIVRENDVNLDGFNSENGYFGAAVYGILNSANAIPSEYSDGVKFVSNRPFHLKYIPGTGKYENNGIGKNSGYKLSDDVVSSGVQIGYSAMDGKIPGGYPFASYSTILVYPVFDD